MPKNPRGSTNGSAPTGKFGATKPSQPKTRSSWRWRRESAAPHEPSKVRSRALQRGRGAVAPCPEVRAEALYYEPFPFRVLFYNSTVPGETPRPNFREL